MRSRSISCYFTSKIKLGSDRYTGLAKQSFVGKKRSKANFAPFRTPRGKTSLRSKNTLFRLERMPNRSAPFGSYLAVSPCTKSPVLLLVLRSKTNMSYPANFLFTLIFLSIPLIFILSSGYSADFTSNHVICFFIPKKFLNIPPAFSRVGMYRFYVPPGFRAVQ